MTTKTRWSARWAATTLLVAGMASTAATAGPVLEVEQRELHVGEIVRGELIEAEFTLRNAGDQVLRIDRVKPG